METLISLYWNYQSYIHKNWMFPFIYNNTWITDDKVLHFIVAFILSYIMYIYKSKISIKKAFLIIIIISLVKEFFDLYTWKWNFELLDIFTNLLWFGMVSLFYLNDNYWYVNRTKLYLSQVLKSTWLNLRFKILKLKILFNKVFTFKNKN